MCGIAGHVTPAPVANAALVARMTAALAHRGPDDGGLLVRPHVALGHRRLAIVDRAGGKQPLANEDGTVWVSYNGEIYNHEALRHDLEGRGHRFRTRSDTEVIVHAYEEDGPACVARFRGMFAFALWDAPRRRLVLARDRLGIKPLYYAASGPDLLFASDLQALLRDPALDRRLDEDALACYLALRYVPAPLTMLASVRKLPPATLLVWEAGALDERRYWDAADAAPLEPSPPSEAEEAARLRDLVDECVAMRLMSEVPVGSFLSGGVDSTAVTAAMLLGLGAAAATHPLRTFSVGYDDAEADSELPFAALAAHALGTRHREVRLDAREAAEALPRIIADLDEPVADPAAVPLWFLARRARDEVTVVLSGEGADELLAGYSIYRRMAQIDRLRAHGLGRIASLVGALAPSEKLRRAGLMATLPLERRYRGVARGLTEEGLAELAGPSLATRAEGVLAALLEPIWERSRAMTPLARMLYLDLRVWLPDDLLVKADKMTMAHSLELHVPLLDHRLVEHAMALPDALKLRGAEGKRILRRAVRGRVPRPILERAKKGFATPTASWLRGPLLPALQEALLDGATLAGQRFRPAALERLIAAHVAGGVDRSPELWTLLTLELWHRAALAVPALGDDRLDDHQRIAEAHQAEVS